MTQKNNPIPDTTTFQRAVLGWHNQHGRKHLPWQQEKNSYHIWLSEIMLQQTQVSVVVHYFEGFIQTLPDIKQLAQASEDQVLALWSGLGYYSRARNMHKAAQIILKEHNGKIPNDFNQLIALPGIGRTTAGAILASAYDQPTAILDGNIKRVLARQQLIAGNLGQTAVIKRLWALSEQLTPEKHTAAYNQAMMDIGAMLCKRRKPLCNRCPISFCCMAYQQNQQSMYPHPKPRKALPQKKVDLLIIKNPADETLLQKRPQSGVWAGLWSLPESSSNQEQEQTCIELTGESGVREKQHRQIAHQFSHYILLMRPIEYRVNNPGKEVMDRTDLLWYKNAGNQTIGIAAPIKRLLEEMK